MAAVVKLDSLDSSVCLTAITDIECIRAPLLLQTYIKQFVVMDGITEEISYGKDWSEKECGEYVISSLEKVGGNNSALKEKIRKAILNYPGMIGITYREEKIEHEGLGAFNLIELVDLYHYFKAVNPQSKLALKTAQIIREWALHLGPYMMMHTSVDVKFFDVAK